MLLKWMFDRVVSLLGLLLVVAILIKVKMPGGPAFFVQKRVGRGGKLFKCHKFLDGLHHLALAVNAFSHQFLLRDKINTFCLI
jgi:lipopolysaccharide/colanic/teichoic acid biosynthesis glycosyltransferase